MNMEPFENLDRLLQIEFRAEGMPAGIVRQYYSVVRQGEPLTYQAARALLDLPDAARVAIITGMAAEFFPHGEIDGPIGFGSARPRAHRPRQTRRCPRRGTDCAGDRGAPRAPRRPV